MADGVPVLIHERWLPSFVFHMRGVNERAQCTFFICSPSPSRNTASGKSVVNFGFTTFFDSMFFPKSPISTAAWSSTEMNFLSPSIILSRLFLLQALYNHLDWAVAIFLMVCPEFDRMDQVVANYVWRRVRSKHFCFSAVHAVLYDQNSVRSFPIVLAAASRTPQAALPLSVPR